MKTGIVYLINGVGTRRYKIGYTSKTSVRDRFKQLSSASAIDLLLVAATPGSYETERTLHHKYREYFLRNEWFEFALDETLSQVMADFNLQPLNIKDLIGVELGNLEDVQPGISIGPVTPIFQLGLSVQQAAERLGCSTRFIRAELHAGKLKAKIMGKQIFIPVNELEMYVNNLPAWSSTVVLQ